MNWTMPQVIGHNVKAKREAMGMTAAALGEKIGEVFGKPWPRQTVYMMESGDRAMVAQEVVALSQLLDMPLMQLFTPPADVEAITAGALSVPAESLLAQPTDDEHMMRLAQTLRALDQTRGKLFTLSQQQYVLLADAKNALLGKPPMERPQGDGLMDGVVNHIIQGADEHYKEDGNGEG